MRGKPDYSDFAADMDLWKPCDAPVQVGTKVKKPDHWDMSYRFFFSFPLIHQARQVLLREVVGAMWPVSTSQMMFSEPDDKRGREKAIARVIEHYQQGYDKVSELDINNCYSSFMMEGVAQELCLPESVTRNVLYMQSYTMVPSRTAMGGVDCHTWFDHPDPMVPFAEFFNGVGDDWITAQQGLCAGSKVSPFVAEKLLARVCDDLLASGAIRVVNFVDNFLLMAKSKRELGKAKWRLRGLLHDHPAGPLWVKETIPLARRSGSFEFLGYVLTPTQTGLYAEPKPQILEKLSTLRRKAYRVLNSNMPYQKKLEYYEDMERSHRCTVASFQHWQEGPSFHRRKMEPLRAALEGNGQRLLKRSLTVHR